MAGASSEWKMGLANASTPMREPVAANRIKADGLVVRSWVRDAILHPNGQEQNRPYQ